MHSVIRILIERMQSHPQEFGRAHHLYRERMALLRGVKRFASREEKKILEQHYREAKLRELQEQLKRQIHGIESRETLSQIIDVSTDIRERDLSQLQIVTLERREEFGIYLWLQKSALWPFYERYLRPIRVVSHSLSRCLRLVDALVAWCRADGPVRLVEQASATQAASRFTLLAGASVETPAPEVIPSSARIRLNAPHLAFFAPEVYVSIIDDACVFGATNLIFKRGIAIHHDLYDFQADSTSEELHGIHIVSPRQKTVRRVASDRLAPVCIAKAASFLDKCSPNYAHWMTEVLPRITAFVCDERYKDVPLLIDDSLHANLMQSLAIVCGERRVILVPPNRGVKVGELIVTSVAGYVPWGRRDSARFGNSHGIFNPHALTLVVARVNAACHGESNSRWSDRVYLRRSSAGRSLVNEAEIVELLESQGFLSVFPEKLTFRDQVQLFSSAKHIIGATGAAFANLIFARPDAQIDILIADVEGMSFWYWQNIARATGKDVRYIFGRAVGPSMGVHSDFTVDPESVLAACAIRRSDA